MYKRIQIIQNKMYVLSGSYETVKEAKEVIGFEPGQIEVVDENFIEALKEYYEPSKEVATPSFNGTKKFW